ncbi:NAD(P)H-dependent oxidoreductase [Plebeiibacterium marinum]|uniref:NAD(P)H-dependent oxidoreductase n=1 Tax=Plebeiibacterium marinum TaxID=2992111 RepID=A0AAE3MFF2_9BACT|nr:NAD(P)H-dependent oxidoreductase [Plebeiobacterium marinum]MCW3806914.1 NAD(P)H-dependent oxidoreductase [Plebeiobacterium marinum]
MENLERFTTLIYGLLSAMAILPPLFKTKPFTYYLTQKKYPSPITSGQQFLRINNIMSFIWGGLFLLAIGLQSLTYHSNEITNAIFSAAVPILLFIIVGIPLTKHLPSRLTQIIGGSSIRFNSLQEMFTCMPYGLNKKAAGNTNAVIQFFLTGKEPITGYLTIKNKTCTYTHGEYANPTSTIKSDSELWLKISNQETDRSKEFLNNNFEIEGNAGILLKLHDMFSPPQKTEPDEWVFLDYEYKSMTNKKIENIVVFDGGARSSGYSKTSFMVSNFLKGAQSAGAKTEYFKLNQYKIEKCVGCYHCWTKSPGKCIFNDDMTLLREKYRNADLLIFASPLYVYSVTGIMKSFMDRLLPELMPYMKKAHNGLTFHPRRFTNNKKQGFVIFSAAGFPETAQNFEGLTSLFRCMDSHHENSCLMGEFLLPAAELITHSVYAERKNTVAEICYQAGIQIIKEGYINKKSMLEIQKPMVSKETFHHQANVFWEIMENKQTYFNGTPKL